jgi:hypothetical protein
MTVSGFQTWLQLALRRDVVLRATRVALLVGTILALINHGDRLMYGGLEANDYLKIVLTYFVPYCVSTFASVQTVRHHGRHPSDLV